MSWKTIFMDPDSPLWCLLSDGMEYMIHHDCGQIVRPGGVFYYGRVCISCGDDMPDALWGFYELCAWDR